MALKPKRWLASVSLSRCFTSMILNGLVSGARHWAIFNHFKAHGSCSDRKGFRLSSAASLWNRVSLDFSILISGVDWCKFTERRFLRCFQLNSLLHQKICFLGSLQIGKLPDFFKIVALILRLFLHLNFPKVEFGFARSVKKMLGLER